MTGNEDDLIKLIEEEEETVHLKSPGQVRVNLKEERITVRLSKEEMETLDRECKALGVGRSTMIRMILRQSLGLSSKQAATKLAEPA